MERSFRSSRRRLACGPVLVVLLAGCSAGSPATSSPGQTPGGPGTPAPASVGPVATPGQTVGGGLISVAQVSEGRWTSGVLHLEVTGQYELVLDLPLTGGETTPGRTSLTYQHEDPADSRWSLGTVGVSFAFGSDGMGIEAGGYKFGGPCTYTLTLLTDSSLAGEARCDDDYQSYFQGDPREVVVTGSFSAAR